MTQTTTTDTKLPSYIEDPLKTSLTDIQQYLGSPQNYVFGSKKGEKLFTPLTTEQNKSIGNVNWLSNQNLSQLLGIDKAGKMIGDFASFKPGRLIDQKGYLGKISDYTNPYLDEVLNPQIREINDSLQRGRRDLDANQAMSGAFGDARHGVVEQGLYDDAAENIADITGRAHAAAWDNAMGLRSADRDAATQQNANKLTAASGYTNLGQTYLKNFLDVNDALFNAGDVKRTAQKEQSDALRQFQEAISSKRYNDALKMLAVLSGSPQSSTSTTKQKSNDGLTGILGSIFGSLFSSQHS